MAEEQYPVLTKKDDISEEIISSVEHILTSLDKQTTFLGDITETVRGRLSSDGQREGGEETGLFDKIDNMFTPILASFDKQTTFLSGIAETIKGHLSGGEKEEKSEGTGLFDKIGNMFTSKGAFGSRLGKIKEYLEPKKLSPKRNVMIKHSPESVYLAETITGKIDETKEKDEGGGFLSNLLSGGKILKLLGLGSILGPVTAVLSKAAPIGAIAGGLLWMAIDGIKGFFKSEEWGVSKVAGVIGGVFGSVEGGLLGMFKNMGKWALIGAGVGSVVPFFGTLAGGLIGVAVGGILGFIGGENIAKGMDKIGDWFKDIWNSEFVQGIKDLIVDLPGRLVEVGKNAMDAIGREIESFQEDPGAWVSEKWDIVTGAIGEFFTEIKSHITRGFNAAKDWVQNRLINPVYNFFGEVKTKIGEKLEDIGKWIGDYIVDPLKSFFDTIGNFFSKIGEFFSDPWGFIKDSFSGEKMEESAEQTNEALKSSFDFSSVKDAIVKPSGQIIHTSPEDTIIATKSPVTRAVGDDEMEQSMQVTNKYMNDAFNEQVLNTLNQIADILSNQKPSQSNVLQQNFANKYNPQSIMDRLAVSVE